MEYQLKCMYPCFPVSGVVFTRGNLFNYESDKTKTGEKAAGEMVSIITKAGDSWVPARSEVNKRRSYVTSLKNQSRRLGLIQVRTKIQYDPDLIIKVRKLGTSYRPIGSIK